MNKNVREKVLEIVKIAQECPENLQQVCFETLLRHSLEGGKPARSIEKARREEQETDEKKRPESIVKESVEAQDDLTIADLHVKARRFLDKYGLTVNDVNQLFYKEGDQILPLYEELNTTRTSESQVRITLLECLRNGIRSGNFTSSVEAVKGEAERRKCYDVNNWNNNFTNNAILFDFTKYSKNVRTISLSDKGRTELAELIKELK